jgi:Txe/YoeB family toxin of Txe-Axe toxin-antitoxin module
MKKPVRIILLGDAKKEYEKLNELAGMQLKEGKENSEEIQLLKSIKQKIELIKDNPFYGDNIEKNKIPKNYEVNNLWRVELAGFWRMLYTIKGDKIEIICFVLNIVDHNNYNKIFGYKKN